MALKKDHFAPHLSNNNFQSKSTVVEVGFASKVGYGPWPSCTSGLFDALNWLRDPWDLLDVGEAASKNSAAASLLEETTTKSVRIIPGDQVDGATLWCKSATDLDGLPSASLDLIITDPPFGGLLHYSELADFFHVWLRLALKRFYPDFFSSEESPKALEAVSIGHASLRTRTAFINAY